MEFFNIVAGVVQQKSANVVIPHRKCQPAGAAVLIGKIQAIVIIAVVWHTIEVVNAIVVESAVYSKTASMVVDDIKRNGDAINVTQIDQRFELVRPDAMFSSAMGANCLAAYNPFIIVK